MDPKHDLFNGVFCCQRDIGLMKGHSAAIDEFMGCRVCRRFYFGQPCAIQHPDVCVFKFQDTYENLPVKLYCMFRDALTIRGWTHLLKTDVNSRIARFDREAADKADLMGYYSTTVAGRNGHRGRVTDEEFNEDYRGELPAVWCGGPAYLASRRLVQAVVAKGIWYARGHAYEDNMVSLVANQNGMVPQAGICYETDGQVFLQ